MHGGWYSASISSPWITWTRWRASLEQHDLDTAEQLTEQALSISKHWRSAF